MTDDGPDDTPRSLFDLAIQGRVKSLEDSRGFWKWVAGLGVPLMAAALGGLLVWGVDKLETSARITGRQEATIEAQGNRINLLEGYVHELLRHAGLYSKPIVDGRVGVNP